MTSSHYDVLIIGAGGVAQVVAHKVAQWSGEFGEIHMANRTQAKADAIVDSIRDKGTAAGLTITTHALDAMDADKVAALIREKRVAKLVCSYPRSAGSHWFKQRWDEGQLELELVPQGTLSERMRAAGAGLGGFFTPAGADSLLAEGKEVGDVSTLADPSVVDTIITNHKALTKKAA